jgi:hypothetical protein
MFFIFSNYFGGKYKIKYTRLLWWYSFIIIEKKLKEKSTWEYANDWGVKNEWDSYGNRLFIFKLENEDNQDSDIEVEKV